MICLSLKTRKNFSVSQAHEADFLELRNDFLAINQIKRLINRSPRPIILTLKKPRIEDLKLVNNKKVAYVDIDYRQPRLIKHYLKQKPRSQKLIISLHNLQKTPSFKVLSRLIRKFLRQGANIIKVATRVNKLVDLKVLKDLRLRFGAKVIIIGLGELGLMTRREINKWQITYAALSPQTTTGLGQLSLKELKKLKLYGLIGYPIQYSLSPKLYNQGFKQKKIVARYQLWETKDLKLVIELIRYFQLDGASVTSPHKIRVKRYLDQLNFAAKKIGAVNTIINKRGKLIGDNADYWGAVQALKHQGVNLEGKSAIILGQGGVARAIAWGLKQAGSQVRMLGRQEIRNFNNSNFDILINATPVGNRLLIPKELITRDKIIFEVIYHRTSKLVQLAKQKGCLIIFGSDMLKYQWFKQFKLLT